MAESEVKSAALWLGKLLVAEINYLDAVTDKVEQLKTELITLAAFLMEAVKSRRQDELVQTALSNARSIAYDCQDVIETYILEVARHGYEEYEGCQLGSALRMACLFRNAPSVHEIRSKIDVLNGRISGLKSDLLSYGITGLIYNSAAESNQEPHINEPLRRFFSHEREEDVVVGLEDHLEELVDKLLDPKHQTVIAISGMGGIGKSTLARELYYHPKLRDGDYFEAFGWAPVSQQFHTDRVLRTLLYSLVPEEDQERMRIDENIRAGRAHHVLFHLMIRVKCLVVIDDVWTSVDWARLEAAFPRRTATGSKILLTTRNEETVSRLHSTQVYLRPIKGLDETKSWELFDKITFPGSTCTDSMKEKLGREMLQHCNGVPLAIVVLGKVLQGKQSVDNWKQMRDDIFVQIQRGDAPNTPYKEVYDVLQVSYDELPFHLKNCFLHLANFPEDYEIPTEKLFQLWVGEGIVLREGTNELEEDVAERYLNELVRRNMVQVASWVEETQRIEKCHLHDLMRDVCIDIAKREVFLRIINCQKCKLLTADKNEDHLFTTVLPERDKSLRHLAVYVSDHQPAQSSTLSSTAMSASAKVSRAPNLRSLLLFPENKQQGNEDCKKFVETISEDFPLLRVFDCEDFDIKGKLPKKVGNLIHLRYFGLANTGVTELPSSIHKLRFLQTLDLRVDANMVVTIPNILWRMKQLRHLYLPYHWGLGSAEKQKIKDAPKRYLIEGGGMLRLDGLWNLQTMLYIDLDRVDVEGLSKLERLNTLVAACETNKKALYALPQCSNKRSFTLRIHAKIINEDPMILSRYESMYQLDIHAEQYENFTLKRPLSLDMLPKSLVRLSMWYLQLIDDPLPAVEKIHNLAHLSLHMCYRGSRMVCSAGGFPELVDLCLDGLSSFRHWEVEEGALRKLKTLRIFNSQVTKIPEALPASVNVKIT